MIAFLLTFFVFVLSFAALGIGALWLRPLRRGKSGVGCAPSDCAACERRED